MLRFVCWQVLVVPVSTDGRIPLSSCENNARKQGAYHENAVSTRSKSNPFFTAENPLAGQDTLNLLQLRGRPVGTTATFQGVVTRAMVNFLRVEEVLLELQSAKPRGVV
jgi:hypothetical protein